MCTESTEPLSGLDQKKTLEAVPSSDDVMCSRVDDISFDIVKQVSQESAASPFPAEVLAHAFAHCGHADATEEFLLCELPLQTTKAVNVLEVVESFFAK